MKTFLQVLNGNLGTDFKNVDEYAANTDKIDMKVVAMTIYQYILYQDVIESIDTKKIKVKLEIKKDEQRRIKNMDNKVN